MEHLKYVRSCITSYAIMIMWLAGCSSNEGSELLSKINNFNNTNMHSHKMTQTNSGLQIKQSKYSTVVYKKKHNSIRITPQDHSIYYRHYREVQKGSYLEPKYRVKCGDTLFYIAWITGNNYINLAQKNNIHKPYILKVGQILQLDTQARLTNYHTPSKKQLMLNTIQTSSKKFTQSSAIDLNTKLQKSKFDFNKKFIKHRMVLTNTIYSSASAEHWHWPTNGKIIDSSFTINNNDKGVDISGLRGQPILATASGTVVYAGNALRGYGNLIIIKHGNDYLSAYAHNDSILVRERQKVKSGQKIATMGSTGTNTTMLHFEIRYKGKPVNPLLYLP